MGAQLNFTPLGAHVRFRWLFLLVVVAVVVAVTWHQIEADRKRTSASCANRFLQLKTELECYLDENDNLPFTRDSQSAMAEMFGDTLRDKSLGLTIAESKSCPDGDDPFGYEFVGQGLSRSVIRKRAALVLFCPEDHGNDGHFHAYRGDGSYRVHGRAQMLAVLAQALRQYDQGEVVYSPESRAIIAKYHDCLRQEGA